MVSVGAFACTIDAAAYINSDARDNSIISKDNVIYETKKSSVDEHSEIVSGYSAL